MKKYFIKKNELIVYVLILPFFLNSFYNFFYFKNYKILFEVNFYLFLLSFVLNSFFYFLVAKLVKENLKLETYSLSLVYFLLSFFVFDSIFLPFTKNILFSTSINLVLCLWIIFFFIKNKTIMLVFKTVLVFIILRIFNIKYFFNLSNLSNYEELNTDVPLQWFKLARMIYENNYFYALKNNLIEGQGLLPSYFQSLSLEISFGIKNYLFVPVTINILLFFSLLIIFDLKIDQKNKFIFSGLLIVILLNNNWLKYLIINSLMLEGIVSYLVCVFLLNIKLGNSKDKISSSTFFLVFGTLMLTKNFISIICMFIFFGYLIKFKTYPESVFSFFVYCSYLIYQYLYLLNIQKIAYTNELSIKDTIFDILLLKNLNLQNISNIVNQFLIDKPTTYLLLLFFLSFSYNFFKRNISNKLEIYLFLFVIFNYILVNFLYISYWQNIEIQSSYRYIIICFHIIYTSTVIQLNKIIKQKNN